MRLSLSVVAVLLGLGASGCYRQPVASTSAAPASIPNAEPSAAPSAQPTASAQPTSTDVTEPNPRPGGSPSDGCVNGWTTPEPGSSEYEEPLAILNTQMGVTGDWTVNDMRFFTGPELPFVEPTYPSVERWYVKASLPDDSTFRGRWLIERRTEQIVGISAVARFESIGYESPDWTGFVGEGPPTSYVGLPGQWYGIPYDFVTGEGDSGQPGLPDEVAGCLGGT